MLKYVIICSVILLIANVIPAYSVYEAPTNKEKTLFDQLLSQFETVNAQKKDVSDVIGTFEKTMLITFSCSPSDTNSQIIIQINTRLAKFDESTVHQDLVTGGSYTWHCSETTQAGKDSLICNNELRINPKVISNDTQVDPRLHSVENLVILYHELLHGQLMIDAIKGSTIWQKETCNSQSGEDIDYSFADPDHKIINYLQTQFASELVDTKGGKIITKEISPDMTNNGTFTIKMLSFTNYPSFENGAKITLRTSNISEDSFFQIKGDVYLNGHLKDASKSGIAWLYLFNNEKTQNVTQEPIPGWAKRVAGLWSSEQGHDSDFYSMINYLVEHNIVNTDEVKNTISTVPHWLQKDAHLWFTGEIDDNTFVNSIQYLITTRVIS